MLTKITDSFWIDLYEILSIAIFKEETREDFTIKVTYKNTICETFYTDEIEKNLFLEKLNQYYATLM